MIRAIIFDLDGTLVNAYPAVSQSVNYTLKTMGFKPHTHAQIKRAVGWGDRQLMAQFEGEALSDIAITVYRPHHAKAILKPGGVRFLSGAQALLKALHGEGYKLAVASNRPTRFTLLVLHQLNIRRLFDVVLCADRAPRPKPYPEILRVILKRLRLSRAEALYVGDMTIDVNTGQRAGVRTIVVTTGSSTRPELKALKPHAIVPRINQLKIILKKESK